MCGNFRALACLWRWRSCNCAGGRGRCWSFPFDGVSLSVSWHRFVGLVHFHRCPPLNYGRPFFNRIWSRWSASSRPAPLSSLAFRGFHEVGSFHFFCGLSAFHSPLFAKFYGLCLSGRLGVSFIGERNYARRSCSAVYCVKVNVLWVISCLFPVLFYTLLDFFLVFVFLETLVTDDASHMVFKTIFSLVYVLGVIPIRIRVKFNHFCKAASSIFHVDFWVKKKTRGGRPGATLGRRWIKSNLFSSSYFLRSFPSAHPLPSYPIKSFSVVGTAVKPGHTHGKRGRNTSRRCGDFGPKTSDKTQSNLTENNQMKKKYYLNSLRNDLRDLSWKSIHQVGKSLKSLKVWVVFTGFYWVLLDFTGFYWVKSDKTQSNLIENKIKILPELSSEWSARPFMEIHSSGRKSFKKKNVSLCLIFFLVVVGGGGVVPSLFFCYLFARHCDDVMRRMGVLLHRRCLWLFSSLISCLAFFFFVCWSVQTELEPVLPGFTGFP